MRERITVATLWVTIGALDVIFWALILAAGIAVYRWWPWPQ